MSTNDWLILRNDLIVLGPLMAIGITFAILDWLADRRDRRSHDRAA